MLTAIFAGATLASAVWISIIKLVYEIQLEREQEETQFWKDAGDHGSRLV